MRSASTPVPLLLLLLWALFVFYGTTLPFDLRPGLQTLARGWEMAHKLPWRAPGGGWPSLPDMVTNLLLLAPWGMLLGIHLVQRGRGRLFVLLAGAVSSLLLSLAVEFLQLFSSTRTTSANDLLMNTLGGAAGTLFGLGLARRAIPALWPRLQDALRRHPLQTLAVAVAALWLLAAAAPFDLSLDVDDLKRAVKAARPIPFGPPLRGESVPVAPWEVAADVLDWVLLGGVFALGWGERGIRAARLVLLSATAAAGLAGLAELGQLGVVSRGTDATSILVALSGAAMGAVLVGRLGARPTRLIGPALVLWLTGRVLGAWAPWEFAPPLLSEFSRWRLLPFIHYFLRTDLHALADLVLQLLAFVPLGALLRARNAEAVHLAVAAVGAAVGLLLEAGQLFVPGRVADVTDALVAAAGAYLGSELWAAARTQVRLSLERDPRAG